MGKNVHGGAKHKKFARKNANGGGSAANTRLRVPTNANEVFAIVTKMLGNNMFHCHCMDDVVRLGHIRGKFTGRAKRDNFVACGKWVIIGRHDWTSPLSSSSSSAAASSSLAAAAASSSNDATMVTTTDGGHQGRKKMEKCELLEVFNDLDKQRLRDSVPLNWALLDRHDAATNTGMEHLNADGCDIVFQSDADYEREQLLQSLETGACQKMDLMTQEDDEGMDDGEINVDDI